MFTESKSTITLLVARPAIQVPSCIVFYSFVFHHYFYCLILQCGVVSYFVLIVAKLAT